MPQVLPVASGTLCVFLFALAVLQGETSTGGNPARIEPSKSALEIVERLRSSRMGVDRSGNLWSLNASRSAVTLLSPQGSILETTPAPESSLEVDADSAWGIVALVRDGIELRTQSWKGQPGRLLRLPELAASVCWIDRDVVAVAPQRAAHRVEIWDLAQGQRLRILGKEEPVEARPGVVRARSVHLRYWPARRLLYTLESFTGELQVFSLDGPLVWQARVENPDRPFLEAWLRESDAKARAKSDSQTPLISSLDLGLDEDGKAWVTRRRAANKGPFVIATLTPGTISDWTPKAEDCSVGPQLVVWGDWLISFRSEISACAMRRTVP